MDEEFAILTDTTPEPAPVPPSQPEVVVAGAVETVMIARRSPTVVEEPIVKGDPLTVKRVAKSIASVIDWIFGMVTIVVALAALATVPLLNMLSLGYLLRASARVAQSGRLRDGFVGVRKAAVIGRVVLLSWLFLWPARFVAELSASAELIAPNSGVSTGWQIGLVILTVVTVVHIAWACIRGGQIWHFLWPAPIRFCRWLFASGNYAKMRDSVYDFVVGLNLPGYFWLGLRGFLGALTWLALPVSILLLASASPNPPVAGLLSFFGGLMLAAVVLYLPFIQTHFAVEDRFSAIFEWMAVRRLFRKAPIAFWAALLITLLFAIPLYMLKIELTPREVAWLPSLVFVAFIFPARLLAGWAIGRARKREQPRHWVFRWMARFAAIPVVLIYALIVYATQYLSWYGSFSFLEQHAFLVPAPLGL